MGNLKVSDLAVVPYKGTILIPGVDPSLATGTRNVAMLASTVGGSAALSGLSDVAITTPLDGQMFGYDGTANKWKNQPATTVASYLTTNPGTINGTDYLFATHGTQAVGYLVSGLASYVLTTGNIATIPVTTTTAFALDRTVHHRRTLVCTVAATINFPAAFASVGDGFECVVINLSGGVVTFGAGITMSTGSQTVPANALVRIFGTTATGSNVIFAKVL